jgi:hypothetical protein
MVINPSARGRQRGLRDEIGVGTCAVGRGWMGGGAGTTASALMPQEVGRREMGGREIQRIGDRSWRLARRLDSAGGAGATGGGTVRVESGRKVGQRVRRESARRDGACGIRSSEPYQKRRCAWKRGRQDTRRGRRSVLR